MSLENLLNLSEQHDLQKIELTEERIREQLSPLRRMVAFFREYPDLFVDFFKGEESKFKFFFYQRVFIRVVMRHRMVYATFPRAYSKSFLSVMVLMLRAILYPNSHLFVTTGGKEQAASITLSKLTEICTLLPFIANEINWDRGVTKKSKDEVIYVFKSGSVIDILAAKQSSRGQRRTGGLVEEAILVDGDILNEVIVPTTNVNRQLPDGTRDPKEIVNKALTFITTAGFRNSYAYAKLIELLVQSVIEPDEVMVMGGTYETPVAEGLLDEDFVDKLRLQGTFNEVSFDREYRLMYS